MKINELINLSDNINSINTSESYCDKAFLNGNKLIIPYINLDIMHRDVIGNKDRMRIEFSYLILNDICLIDWIGEDSKRNRIVGRKKFSSNCEGKRTDWFALNQLTDGFEIKVKFNSASLFIPRDSDYGNEWWTTRDTPNFPKNINEDLLEDFYNLKLIPDPIKKSICLNENEVNKFELINGSEDDIRAVEEDWINK